MSSDPPLLSFDNYQNTRNIDDLTLLSNPIFQFFYFLKSLKFHQRQPYLLLINSNLDISQLQYRGQFTKEFSFIGLMVDF
jgi:hypothetical protein